MDIKDCKIGMPVRCKTKIFSAINHGEIFTVLSYNENDQLNIKRESDDEVMQVWYNAQNFEPAYQLEVGCKVRITHGSSAYLGLPEEGIVEAFSDYMKYVIINVNRPLQRMIPVGDLIVIEPAPKKECHASSCYYYNSLNGCPPGKCESGTLQKWKPKEGLEPEPTIPSGTAFGVACPHYDEPCHLKENGQVSCGDCRNAGKHLYSGCDCIITESAISQIRITLPEGYEKGMASDVAKMLKADLKIHHGYKLRGKSHIMVAAEQYEELIKDSICKALDVDRSVLDIQPGHTRPLIDIDYPKINMFPQHLVDRLKVSSAMHGIALEQWRRIIGGNKMEEKDRKIADKIAERMDDELVGTGTGTVFFKKAGECIRHTRTIEVDITPEDVQKLMDSKGISKALGSFVINDSMPRLQVAIHTVEPIEKPKQPKAKRATKAKKEAD